MRILQKLLIISVCVQAEMVKAAFEAQRKFLNVVSKCKQPAQQMLESLLKPTSEQIAAVQVCVLIILIILINCKVCAVTCGSFLLSIRMMLSICCLLSLTDHMYFNFL